MNDDSRDKESMFYPDDENRDDWDFADALVDCHVNVRASPRGNVDAVCKLCSSANVTVPEMLAASLARRCRTYMLS